MIKSFKIKQPKDDKGMYILPMDLKEREGISKSPILYPNDGQYKHLVKTDDKNVLFAIICVVYEGRKGRTEINSWGLTGVMINNYFLPYDRYYLDSENDVLYEAEHDTDKFLLKRLMKLKKLKNNLVNNDFF